MAKNKKSFILYCDSLAILKALNNEQAGMLFKAIAAYHNNEAQVLPTELSLVFILFKNQFERDENKWQEIKNKRVVAGAKGGKQKVANATKSKQKPPVSVNDNVTVNDKYKSFIVWFNGVMDKKYKGDKISEGQFNARLKENYTSDNFKNALLAIRDDKFHKENNYKHITPEFLTRSAQLEKWSNFKIEKNYTSQLPNAIV